MGTDKLLLLKSELLCLGIRIEEKTLQKLSISHAYFFDKGFVHAVNINIGGSNICVSAAERFCQKSPYVLTNNDGKYYMYKNGERLIEVTLFDQLPVTGTIIDQIAKPHSAECISLWPSLNCCFDTPDKKCKFCSIRQSPSSSVIPSGEVVDGLGKLFKINADYSLNIGGGTYKDPDRMAAYLIEIIGGVRKFTQNPVSIELAPPNDLSYIDKLFHAGATSLIINLEVCDDELRKKICPGKHAISYEHYYKTYERAVSLFGRGKISCVLVVGIQPNADIKRECGKLTDAGVIPTLIPFKPMDDCAYHTYPVTSPATLTDAAQYLSGLLTAKGLYPQKQEGCTKCGGCSLETNYCKTGIAT